MKAVAEITGVIIRVYDESVDLETNKYQSNYDMVVYGIGDLDDILLKGFKHKNPTIGHLKAISTCLKELGFKTLRWTRHGENGGVSKEVVKKL